MATKKSPSSKAKTKKTAAKAATTKTAKQDTQKKATGKQINVMRLKSLNMASAGLFILLALLAGMFMDSSSFPLSLGYLTEDILAEGSVWASAARIVYDIELRWMVVAILALSAIVPLLRISYWDKKYSEAVIKRRTLPWRWVDFAVTGALMVEATALLSGVHDLMALKLVGGIVAVSFVLSLIAEWHYKFSKPAWKTFVVAAVSAAMPWLLIAGYAVSTVVYGTTWSPWYVYASYAAVALGILAIFCIQFTDYRGKKTEWQQNYMIVERNYIAVNVLTKAAFTIILIFGLLK